MTIRIFACALVGALLAAPAWSQSEETPAAPAEASAATPSEGMATIVFFRPKKLLGAAIGFIVREDGVELGKLRNGNYFVLQVAPGAHSYTVHSETKDVLAMEVEAGQTYYVMGSLGMGVVAGRPNLSPSDEQSFAAIKSKLKERAPISGDDEKAEE